MADLHAAATTSPPRRGFFIAPALLLVVLLNDRCRAAEEVDEPVIKPASVDARPLAVNNNWAVWRTTELIEATRSFRGPVFTHRFYRQKLNEHEARFAFRMLAGAGWGDRHVTIREDGVILFVDRNRVKWCELDGAIHATEEVPDGMIRRLDADGVVVQAGTSIGKGGKLEPARATWLPFKEHTLDLDRMFEIAPVGMRTLDDTEPARAGDVLAWLTPDRIHLMNVRTRKKTVVAIEDRNATEFNLRRCRVSAFDGETILAGGNVVLDAKTGARLATYWNDKRINYLFVTSNRIGYRLKEGDLEAVELSEPSVPPFALARGVDTRVFHNDGGLVFWTGDKWQTIPWLKSFPR